MINLQNKYNTKVDPTFVSMFFYPFYLHTNCKSICCITTIYCKGCSMNFFGAIKSFLWSQCKSCSCFLTAFNFSKHCLICNQTDTFSFSRNGFFYQWTTNQQKWDVSLNEWQMMLPYSKDNIIKKARICLFR